MKERNAEEHAETIAAAAIAERVAEVRLEAGGKTTVGEGQLDADAGAHESIAA